MAVYNKTSDIPVHRALFQLERSTERFKIYEEIRPNSPPDGSTHNLGVLYLDKDKAKGLDHVGVHIELGMCCTESEEPSVVLPSRAEAVALINEQMLHCTTTCRKPYAIKYGRQELRSLLDFIYGGEPTTEAGKLKGCSTAKGDCE